MLNQKLHTTVYSSIIHNCPPKKWEEPKCWLGVNGLTIVVSLRNGTLLSSKDKLLTQATAGVTLTRVTLREGGQTHTAWLLFHRVISPRWFSGRGEALGGGTSPVAAEGWGRGEVWLCRGRTRDVLGVRRLCFLTAVKLQDHVLVVTHRMYN